MSVRRALLAVAIGAMASACGGGGGSAFGLTYPDNVQADIANVLQRLSSAGAPDDSPVAAVVTTDGKLTLVDLAAERVRWSQPVQSAASAPRIAGNTVVVQEQSGVVVRSLADGRTLATIDDEALHLAGAGGEGALTIVSLTTGGGVGARSKLVLLDGSRVKWTKEITHAAGAPAIAGGMVFIPWATQNVSVLEADGTEIARIRLTDSPVGHVFRHESDVYFAQRGLFRLTPTIREGSREGSAYFEAQLREIPGQPTFTVDPYRPPPPPESALHRVRYGWHPAGAGEDVALSDDLLYGVFYRLVFGLHPSEDSVRWIYQHDHDVVGVLAQEGGLLLADESGGFHFVSAEDGRTRWHYASGATAVVVSMRADHFAPGGAPDGAAPSLADQLLSAAQNTDSRLVPARALAIHMLHTLDDPVVTGHIISLCDDPQLPPVLRTEACGAIASRTTGSEHVVRALERHARYLEGTTAPPVAALARAAAAMNEQAAVPLLIAHLRDPETAEADLVPLIEAMKSLGGRSAVEPLTDFMRLYHAEAQSDAMVAAMRAGADALAALQGPAAREVIHELAEDPLAPIDVRNQMRAALTAMEEAAAAADAEAGGEAEGDEAEGDGDEGDGDTEEDDRPERVTASVVDRVLRPVRQEMSACVRDDSGNAPNARLVIRLSGSGDLEALSVQPPRLQSCIEPLVRRVRFPANRQNIREQVSYTVRR